MTTQGTYYKKRNEFSEMHYQLPVQQCLFDIDYVKGQWLGLNIEAGKEEATYVEYTRLRNSNTTSTKFDLDRIKWLALFELKYRMCERVQLAMQLKEGTAAWGAFMLAKNINSRFFFVVATEGQPPFSFYEYNMTSGEPVEFNVKLNYDRFNETQKKEVVNYYWKNILNLTVENF